jgi:lipopolysaccharide export system permease protein
MVLFLLFHVAGFFTAINFRKHMKTIRRLIYIDLITTIVYVCLGFLALFSFFDFVDELPSIGNQYQIGHALLYVALQLPGHIYELLPIATLIGGVLVMARFAQSSEFTILRTSGLGPVRALKTLLTLGISFVFATFLIGDYIAPYANKTGQLLKAKYQGGATIGQTGAWLKERQTYHRYAVNISALTGDGDISGVQIFEFDGAGSIVSLTQAKEAQFAESAWLLSDVKRMEFPVQLSSEQTRKSLQSNWQSFNLDAVVKITRLAQLSWPTELTAETVSVALLKPERMSAYDLFHYIRHLDDNSQSAQLYEIEFWKKIFYPLSCLVMLMLSLPFAYLHFRSGGIAGYVFIGIMTGISFFLLNNVFGYIGNISHWLPWLAAAIPSLLYLLLSLLAFAWVVVRR